MRNPTRLCLLLALSLLNSGCSDDDATTPVTLYGVSGQVIPLITAYGASDAPDVKMEFTDSRQVTKTVRSDQSSHYEVAGLAPGFVTLTMTGDTAFTDRATGFKLPAYIPTAETFTLRQDTVITFRAREYTMIWGDGGSATSEWDWEYGVRNDGEMYLFWYDIRGSDMRLNHDIQVPENIQRIGFMIKGQTAPSNTSDLRASLVVNGQLQSTSYLHSFDTTEGWWIQELDPAQLAGDRIRLNLEYQRYTAEYVLVKMVIVYVY